MRPSLRSVLVLIFAFSSCGKANSTPLGWDLSEKTDLSKVGWPKDIKEELWYVEGPGTIHLKARDGYGYKGPFWFAQVWREGNRVSTVCIMLPIGSVDEAYANATRLADQMNLKDRRGIEDFKQNRGERILRGQPAVGSMSPEGDFQSRVIEIRHCYAGPEKQWLVTLILGFPARAGSSNPGTTQPTTRPASN